MLKRISRFGILILTPVLLGVSLYFFYRELKIEEYRDKLLAAGFPRTYAEPLAKLQFKYPAWRFEKLPIEDLEWKAIVAKELTPSWNLVVYANWAVGKWNRLKEKNYTPYYAKDAKAYDSGSWYQASEEAIAYFMDPRNFLNAQDVFMFETLGFDARSQTLSAVEATLSKTFMAKKCYDDSKKTFAELVHSVGERYGVSPVFLAGRLSSEQGSGSTQAFGTIGNTLVGYAAKTNDTVGTAVIWGKRFTRDNEATKKVLARGAAEYNGYYNFFNFRAYGLGLFEIKYNAYIEAKTADAKYCGPWNTQARAIEGGSIKIKERYIDSYRHTRYLQKFSVLAEAGSFRWKQYMQNIAAPLIESRNTYKSYKVAKTLKNPYRFLIPVYKSMPDESAADPAKGHSVYSPSK